MHPCDMPRVSMSHIAHVEKSCHTHKWVMLHARMSPVQLETRRTHQWVMSHMKMSHVLRVNESRGTHALVTAHSHTHSIYKPTCGAATHQIWHTFDMWMRHRYDIWLSHTCDSFICKPMTHSYVGAATHQMWHTIDIRMRHKYDIWMSHTCDSFIRKPTTHS